MLAKSKLRRLTPLPLSIGPDPSPPNFQRSNLDRAWQLANLNLASGATLVISESKTVPRSFIRGEAYGADCDLAGDEGKGGQGRLRFDG